MGDMSRALANLMCSPARASTRAAANPQRHNVAILDVVISTEVERDSIADVGTKAEAVKNDERVSTVDWDPVHYPPSSIGVHGHLLFSLAASASSDAKNVHATIHRCWKATNLCCEIEAIVAILKKSMIAKHHHRPT